MGPDDEFDDPTDVDPPLPDLELWEAVGVELGDDWSMATEPSPDASGADPSGAELLEGPLHDANYDGVADEFDHH